MKHITTRKALKELRTLCRRNGIIVTIVPKDGPGSHQGLIFEDSKTGQKIRIVIAGKKDISPGVQRNVLKYLSEKSGNVAIAKIVKKIFESIFS